LPLSGTTMRAAEIGPAATVGIECIDRSDEPDDPPALEPVSTELHSQRWAACFGDGASQPPEGEGVEIFDAAVGLWYCARIDWC
jgi:hypothetical protein